MQRLFTALVAPSRYDAKGVIVYRVGISQMSTLSTLAGLFEDYNLRHRASATVRYEIFDEHVREAVRPELLRRWRDEATQRGERFVLMLCGVQTACYPRARDIAFMARREGIPVIAGGVHLSAHGPSAEFLAAHGVSVAIGEAEPMWDRIMADAFADRLAPIYRLDATEGVSIKTAVSDITASDMGQVPYPHIPKSQRGFYLNRHHLYIDASRGCPFLCTFCTVKNLFGRTMRSRDPRTLVDWVAARVDEGTRLFSFTDDNFVRNPHHGEILEGLAAIRQAGRSFGLSIVLDVESTCYAEEATARGERTRQFLALCRAAGVTNVFMGLESTNDAALQEMRKATNRSRSVVHAGREMDPAVAVASARAATVQRYRTAVGAWHSIGASVECGYIIGFAADGPGVGVQAAHDLHAIGVDVPAFYMLTPIPGAEDYARAVRDGTLFETDFNEFFGNRSLVAHPTMRREQVAAEHAAAVREFYTLRNVSVRLIRGLFGIGRARVTTPLLFIKRQLGMKVNVLAGRNTYYQGGFLRRRHAGAPREVVTDAEARAHFLGASATPRLSGLPAEVRADGRMESLPILARHTIETPTAEGTGSPVLDRAPLDAVTGAVA